MFSSYAQEEKNNLGTYDKYHQSKRNPYMETNEDYKTKFDNGIIEDSKFLINSIEEPLEGVFSELEHTLIYDSEVYYDNSFIVRLMCNPSFSTESKLRFINDALNAPKRNIFKSFHAVKCPCLNSNQELKEFFLSYYESKEVLDSVDRYERYKFFQFQLVNRFKESFNTVNNYLQKRKQLNSEELYYKEEEIVVYLFSIGEELKAINFLEELVSDFETGRVPYFTEGELDENPFILLGFSDNKVIAEKAIELALKFFQKNESFFQYKTAKFLGFNAPDKLEKILRDRLKQFRKAGLSDSALLTKYCRFIITSSEYLGEMMGEQLWDELMDIKSFWADPSQREFNSIDFHCAKSIVLNQKISDGKKQEIIAYLRKSKEALSDKSTKTDHIQFTKYLQIVANAFPESKSNLKPFFPEKYKTDRYKNYQIFSKNNIRLFEYLQNLELITKTDLTHYEKFLFETNIGGYGGILGFTKRMVNVKKESDFLPLDYEKLFKKEFKPVLNKFGINSIEFRQRVTDETGEFNYELQAKNSKMVFEYKFKSKNKRYEILGFVKLINRALIEEEHDLRLVWIDSGAGSVLGLFNPNQIIGICRKFGLYSFKVFYEDSLWGAGRYY